MTTTAEAILATLAESGSERMNAAEAISEVALAGAKIAHAITADATTGEDATGGAVASLTEAIMGITAGLVAVAAAIDGLADAVRGQEK